MAGAAVTSAQVVLFAATKAAPPGAAARIARASCIVYACNKQWGNA
jgi:hypothetical protein